MDARDLAAHMVKVLADRRAGGDDREYFFLDDTQVTMLTDAGYGATVKVGGQRAVKLRAAGMVAGERLAEPAPAVRAEVIDNSYYKDHKGSKPCSSSNDGWVCMARDGHVGNHEGYFSDGTSGKSWPNDEVPGRYIDNSYYEDHPGARACGDTKGGWFCCARKGHSGDHKAWGVLHRSGERDCGQTWPNKSEPKAGGMVAGSEYYRNKAAADNTEPCGVADPEGKLGICLAWKGHKGAHVAYVQGGRFVAGTWTGEPSKPGADNGYYGGGSNRPCYEPSPDGRWTCMALVGHRDEHVAYSSGGGMVRGRWPNKDGEWDGNNDYEPKWRMACGKKGPAKAECNARKGHKGLHRDYFSRTEYEREWDDNGKKVIVPGNERWKGKAALRCGEVLVAEGGGGYYYCNAKTGHRGAHRAYDSSKPDGTGIAKEWTDKEAELKPLKLKVAEAISAVDELRLKLKGAPGNEYAGAGASKEARCGEVIHSDDQRIAGQRGHTKVVGVNLWHCLAARGHTGTHRAYDGSARAASGVTTEDGKGFVAEWTDAPPTVDPLDYYEEKGTGNRCGETGAPGRAGGCCLRIDHPGDHAITAGGGATVEVQWPRKGSVAAGAGTVMDNRRADVERGERECGEKISKSDKSLAGQRGYDAWSYGDLKCRARKGHGGAHRSYSGGSKNHLGREVDYGTGWTGEWGAGAGTGLDNGFCKEHELRCRERCPANGGVTACWARKGHSGPHRDWSSSAHYGNEWGGSGISNKYCPYEEKRCRARCPESRYSVCWAEKGHEGAHRDWNCSTAYEHEWGTGDGGGGYSATDQCKTERPGYRTSGVRCNVRKGHSGAHRHYDTMTHFDHEWTEESREEAGFIHVGDSTNAQRQAGLVACSLTRHVCGKAMPGNESVTCKSCTGHSGNHRAWDKSDTSPSGRAVLEGCGWSAEWSPVRETRKGISNRKIDNWDKRCNAVIRANDRRLDGQRGHDADSHHTWTCYAEKGHEGAHRAYDSSSKNPWQSKVDRDMGWPAEWSDADSPDNRYLSLTGSKRRCNVSVREGSALVKGQRGYESGSRREVQCQAEEGHTGDHRSYTTTLQDAWGAKLGSDYEFGWKLEWS